MKTNTTKIPITPNPKGTQKTDFLDGTWLELPFAGLILPRIEDLPMECPTPAFGLYRGQLILEIDVQRIQGCWHWVLTLL